MTTQPSQVGTYGSGLAGLWTAAGIDWKQAVADTQVVDGVNVWNTIMNVDGEHARNDLLYWHGMGELQAIRIGKWKLYLTRAGALKGLDFTQKNNPELVAEVANLDSGEGPLLFNLEAEKGELTEYSSKHPQVVKDLQALAEKWLAEIKSKTIPLYK